MQNQNQTNHQQLAEFIFDYQRFIYVDNVRKTRDHPKPNSLDTNMAVLFISGVFDVIQKHKITAVIPAMVDESFKLAKHMSQQFMDDLMQEVLKHNDRRLTMGRKPKPEFLANPRGYLQPG